MANKKNNKLILEQPDQIKIDGKKEHIVNNDLPMVNDVDSKDNKKDDKFLLNEHPDNGIVIID